MPPILAAVIYLSFVAWLFRRDFREKPNVTSALWLPFFWVFISGGRFISQWLDMFGLNLGGTSVEEGSPVDALIFFFLIAAGVRVLYLRGVSTSEFARYNRWITIYLCYCLIAIVWSEFPFVAFKRWIKLFGQPVMVLILLTEPDPIESLTRMMKRLAYFFVPVSILFIKYFPQWGRAYDTWSGLPSNSGITMGKNILGCDCFILGLFFIWYCQRVLSSEKSPQRKKDIYLCLGFFLLIGWLLYMAHSSTSIGVLVLSGIVVVVLNLKFVDRRRIGVYIVGLVVVLALAEVFFGIHKAIIEALGRDSTLTGRTDIWQVLLHWDVNPILGVGFESFWLGDERRDKLWDLLPGLYLNEAHNGYLETYIQIGLLGVFFTLAMLVSTYFKITRALLYDFDFGRFRMAYFIAFVVYNWTEAVFRTHCFPFFMFFLIAIEYPARRSQKPIVTADVLEADIAEPSVQKTASL